LVHALYDPQGQFKHAMDTTDHGAHGTAVSGIIAAHTLSREELGLPGTSTIRLGVCPAAKLAVVTVAQGECFRETLSLTQLTGGLDWAIENKNHPKWGQYEVVNVSLELVSQLFSSVVQEAVDRTVRQFLPHRLIPIFASGNGGPKAEPLSTLGCCVGSSDRTGRPAPTNGRRVDLCAPGEDLLCVQPPIPQLDNDLISCHSGSSFAAAFVTGTILLLSRRTGRSAWDCLEALLATSGPGKIINPGQAQKEL